MWCCRTARGREEAPVPGTAHALACLSGSVAFTYLRKHSIGRFLSDDFCVSRALSFTIKSNFNNLPKR